MDQPTPKPRTRPARALRRVLVAPGFVLGLWLAQLLFAKLLAAPTRSAAAAAMRGNAWFDDGHRLRALAELFIDEPAVIATIVAALGGSAIVAGLFSVVAAPVMLLRLHGERSWSTLLGTAAAKLPAVLVQSGYGLVFRALCTGLAAVPAMVGELGMAATPLVLLIASFPILVIDRARAAVVLEGERPYHPKTLLRALLHVGKRPLWWLSGTAIEALKLGVGLAALMLVIQAELAGGTVWLARCASLLAIVFGLWRVSLAVEPERAASKARDPRA